MFELPAVTDLDSAIRFVEAFLAKEWTAIEASRAEEDHTKVNALAAEADRFMVPQRERPGCSIGIKLLRPLPPMILAKMRESADQLARRQLFLVREHRHAQLGTIYSCFAGSEKKFTGRMLYKCYFVATGDLGSRIVAEYYLASGRRLVGVSPPIVKASESSVVVEQTMKSVPGGGAGWVHFGGIAIPESGPVIANRVLGPPSGPGQSEVWASLLAGDPLVVVPEQPPSF
jgi:hypothetical protein